MLVRQEKENKLSTPHKQSPFTANQKNGDSVLVEGDGVQYRRNVTHVKKYFERDYDVLPATSKSTNVTLHRGLRVQLSAQRLRVQHKVYQTKNPENL